eukprot:357581-Chlamydomonas_euryale.AAC.5
MARCRAVRCAQRWLSTDERLKQDAAIALASSFRNQCSRRTLLALQMHADMLSLPSPLGCDSMAN